MREPQFQGTGYYYLWTTGNWVIGDTAFDCDFGYIEWNGTQWIQEN